MIGGYGIVSGERVIHPGGLLPVGPLSDPGKFPTHVAARRAAPHAAAPHAAAPYLCCPAVRPVSCSHNPRAARMTENSAVTPSASSIQIKKKPPLDAAIAPPTPAPFM